jgi:hypothetical protein
MHQMWRTIIIAATFAAFAWVGAEIQTVRSLPADIARLAQSVSEKAPDAHGELPQVAIGTTTADVGEIPVGKTVSFEFVVANSGRSLLEITAKPRCGCTVVDYDKSIESGREGRIKLELKTHRLRGKFEKFVDVNTNDPKRPKMRLTLSGSAIPAVEVKPSRSPLAILKPAGPTILELTLNTMNSTQVTDAKVDVPYAQTELLSDQEGRFRLNITFHEEAPFGRASLVLTLFTNAEHQPEIPLTIYSEKGIIVSPASLKLAVDHRAGEEVAIGSVLLRKAGGQVGIIKASSNDENLDVQITTVKAGSLYRLTATGRGDSSNVNAAAAITVETDDPEQSVLTIPVRWSRVTSR